MFVAPKTLLPHSIERLGVKAFTDMKKGLDNCDIVYDVKTSKMKECMDLFCLLLENIMNFLV